jgi:predicted nucleic acid-binding protein
MNDRFVLIDANVIISIIRNELSHYADCSRVISMADNPRFRLFVTPFTLSVCAYYADKIKKNSSKSVIQELVKRLHIAPNLEIHINQALENKKVLDFEDGLQYYAAIDKNCKAIVTLNKKDFYFSSIPIFSPREYLEHIFCKP